MQVKQAVDAAPPAPNPARPDQIWADFVARAAPGSPAVLGHLGQSLDGFIATRSGESRFVTGEENIVHLHRLRAVSDAIVVGASTVAADDPRLTTRLVPGANPLRVVLDPRRRLSRARYVFADGAAPTLLVCDAAHARPGERHGAAEVVGVPLAGGRLDLDAVLTALRSRGCRSVFVEGGGVTVSAFLAAGLLDRLHLTIAPLLIGAGRPGLRLPPAPTLTDLQRGACGVHRMGEDVLFDFDLRPQAGSPAQPVYRIA